MQQRGFTLIELIIVIVILGILAVTAAPRFIDLQGDARASTLDGARAALQGGSQLVYARAAIDSVQSLPASDDDAEVSVNGQTVATDFGYPDADSVTAATLGAWATMAVGDTDATDWRLTVGTGAFTITIGADETGNNCEVVYTNAADANSAPDISVDATGC